MANNMDEEISAKLDEDFKRSLKFIRPYIINLTNPMYITSCRVWLEKMSYCQPHEKVMRNEYLNELCRQIQSGKIDEPFISTPPEGPLVELNLPGSSSSWSDISTAASAEIPGSGDSVTEHAVLQENLSYPNIYEDKIKEQQLIINELRDQNNILKNRLTDCEVQLNSRSSQAEIGINMLASEVEYLKERLRDLIIMKRNLQASHNAITMHWENTNKSLESQLNAEKEKNEQLQQTIIELQNNVDTLRSNTNIDTRKMLDVHIEKICDIYDENNLSLIKSKEAEFDATIQELKLSYDQKLSEISAEAEKNCKFRDAEILRLEKLVEEQCSNSVQKEIKFYRSQAEDECNITNDSLIEKITFLQTCILKMEKLMKKYERHYTRKISFLSNELQMKEHTTQIQLTTQRAQLLAKASLDRQDEIEEVVSQLEERYKFLLKDQQIQLNEIRQEYTALIKKLSDKFDLKA